MPNPKKSSYKKTNSQSKDARPNSRESRPASREQRSPRRSHSNALKGTPKKTQKEPEVRQKSQRALLQVLYKEREKKGIAKRLVDLLKNCISMPQSIAAQTGQQALLKDKISRKIQQQPQNNTSPKNKKTSKENMPSENTSEEVRFVPKPRTEPRRIIISSESLETRVALMTGKRLDEYEIERVGTFSASNAIYFGRICNLEPSLEAAFVDIGEEKNAFLHFKDMLPVTQDLAERVDLESGSKNKQDFNTKLAARLHKLQEESAQKDAPVNMIMARTRRGHERLSVKDAPKLFPPKSEVLVQVTKGPIGTKGPRVSTNISIAGRYLVLLPYSDDVCISKRIDDRKERARLREILSCFNLPKGLGLICRTIGEGRKREHFENDLNMLLEVWENIQKVIRTQKPPVCVYHEPSLLNRTIRDFLTDDIDEIIVDNPEVYKLITDRLKLLVGNKTKLKVKLHSRFGNVFDSYNVSTQISQIFTREVPLKSGGYLCIEETEALVSIDVNTGKSRSGKSLPETIYNTNLEAAEEIARQLRLRNIGGQVVIDFIDMGIEKHRKLLLEAMRAFCSGDRVKTEIAPISRFGLMEMTRRREQESILNAVYDSCPYCHGRGKIRSVFSMSIEIHRRLLLLLQKHQSSDGVSLRVLMHPAVLARMKKEDTVIIDELEKKYHCSLSFRPDENLHLEEFRIVDPITLKSVE